MGKKYQSSIDSRKKYNSMNSTFQISKDLHKKVKDYCKEKNINVKEFLERIIENQIS